MFLTSTKNEEETFVTGQRPQTETPWVLEVTTVEDALLPALPPPLANVQKPKALVTNVKPTFQQNASKYAGGVRKKV